MVTLRGESGSQIAVSLETVGAPLDRRWWDAAASRLLEFGARCGLPPRDLRALTVLVPRISDGPWLRAALFRASGGPLVAARITTLERWVGAPAGPQTQRLVELFEALRASAWAREAFGDRPGGLWALAAELARLGDELTLAAVGSDQSFEGRWRDSVARHFRRRAAVAAGAQAQLVLQLWKAHASAQFGAAALLRQWARRAHRPEGALALLAPFGLAGWQRALLDRQAQAQPVCVVPGDLSAALTRHGWLALTWPELADPGRPPAPIAERCRLARDQAAPRLRIFSTRSLEEEAGAAAAQAEGWLRRGAGRIALVALDRLTARRVRALLERAGILVADQAGWKLSTTSAAAAVMRWLELAGANFRIRDLLDWLRSPFVLAGGSDRLAVARLIDRVARSANLAGGLGAIDRALGRLDEWQPEVDAARAVLARLDAEARRLRAARTLDELAAALGGSLDALGMREALALDPVGSEVLRELARLREAVAGSGVRMSLAAFRELLAQHFESTNASDPGAESPVLMTSLSGACLRDFDAAILIGAGAEHLPAGTEPGVLISSGVRHDLGLTTAADLHRAQAVELATLLCSVPQVAATWRLREGDEPRALSPWLDRLCVMAARAGWPDPVQPFELPRRTVAARASQRPAPQGGYRMPERLSVGACQSLVDCPYQFHARHLLGLRRRQLVSDTPDKRDLGSALHSILHALHRDCEPDRLRRMTDAQLRESLERIALERFARELRERPALVAYRRRVLDLIPGYVDWLRRRLDAGWTPQSVETAFQVVLPVDGPRAIALTGRIDRIDARGDHEVEVIDYKARSHDAVRRAAGNPGEDVQLPLYALALGAAATGASYLSFQRGIDPDRPHAGTVRQIPAAEPFGDWVNAVERRLRADLARILEGEGLPALGAEPVCSNCEMRGLCRRAEWSAD